MMRPATALTTRRFLWKFRSMRGRHIPGMAATTRIVPTVRCFKSSSPLLVDTFEPEAHFERFDPTKSLQEWTRLTEDLLEDPSTVPEATDTSLQAIRFWTTQRQNPVAILNALELFSGLVHQDEKGEYWMAGNRPQSTHVLNAILDAWRICLREKRDDGIEMPSPVDLRNEIEAWADQGLILVDARTYSLLMKANIADAGFCHDCFETMWQERGIQPDIVVLTTMLQSLSEDATRALEFFHHMLALYDQGSLETAPNTVFYNTLLNGLVKSGKVQHAHEILKTMQLSPYPQVAPNKVSYRIVVWGWADLASRLWLKARKQKKKKPNGTGADALRAGFQIVQDAGTRHVDATFYSKLISTSVKYGRDFELAEEIFCALQEQAISSGEDHMQPEVNTLRGMLLLYSKTFRPNEASQLLYTLEELNQVQRGHYRDVVLAYLYSGNAPGAVQSLKYMLDKRESYFCPDAPLIDDVLKVASRNEDASLTEALVRYIHQVYDLTGFEELAPCPQHWVRMLSAWSHSTQAKALQRVIDLVEELEDLPNIDRSHVLAGVTALTRVRAPIEYVGRIWKSTRLEMKPSPALWYAVLEAYIGAHEAKGAHDILHEWLDISEKQQLAEPQPRLCDKVLKMLLESRTMEAEQLQALFDRFPSKNPSHFLRMLRAWSYSKSPDAKKRVQDLVIEMEDEFSGARDKENRLNRSHYTAAAIALSRTKAPVSDILQLLQRASTSGLRPDKGFYAVVLDACANAGDGPQAQSVWESLQKENIRPTVELLNHVLLAWSRSQGNTADKVEALFRRSRHTIQPNKRTFQVLLDCLSKEGGHADMLEFYQQEKIQLQAPQ